MDCTICTHKVFVTERIDANGRPYHKTCFKVCIILQERNKESMTLNLHLVTSAQKRDVAWHLSIFIHMKVAYTAKSMSQSYKPLSVVSALLVVYSMIAWWCLLAFVSYSIESSSSRSQLIHQLIQLVKWRINIIILMLLSTIKRTYMIPITTTTIYH